MDHLGQPFVFTGTARNVGTTDTAAMLDPPEEPNHWTRAVWKRKRVRAYKYVDDGVTTEKVNFENADEVPGTNTVKKKHAIPSQNAFNSTASRAGAKGMKVNTLKTNILCVSDAMSYSPVVYIEAGGEELASKPGATFKLLGFVMSDRPTVRAHVDSILKKFRQRYWTLYNLKKHGFTQEELVTAVSYTHLTLPTIYSV